MTNFLGYELEEWYPASPLVGPPLPKWLKVAWPWYKEEGVPGPVPPPEGGPTVLTRAASDITNDSATLNAEIVSMGSETSVGGLFEYGETTAYGLSTSPLLYTNKGIYSAVISGLLPNTQYHFQAVAVGLITGVQGAAMGGDVSFTTLPLPGVPPGEEPYVPPGEEPYVPPTVRPYIVSPGLVKNAEGRWVIDLQWEKHGAFSVGSSQVAMLPITVLPAGGMYEAEIFLGPSSTTKVVTSGKIKFVSPGMLQTISLPIRMPTTLGVYRVFIDITAGGSIIGKYAAKTNVAIASITFTALNWDNQIFNAGETHKANVVLLGRPANVAFTGVLSFVRNNIEVVASSLASFESRASAISVPFTLVLPISAGSYQVFLTVYTDGNIVFDAAIASVVVWQIFSVLGLFNVLYVTDASGSEIKHFSEIGSMDMTVPTGLVTPPTKVVSVPYAILDSPLVREQLDTFRFAVMNVALASGRISWIVSVRNPDGSVAMFAQPYIPKQDCGQGNYLPEQPAGTLIPVGDSRDCTMAAPETRSYFGSMSNPGETAFQSITAPPLSFQQEFYVSWRDSSGQWSAGGNYRTINQSWYLSGPLDVLIEMRQYVDGTLLSAFFLLKNVFQPPF